MTEQNQRPGTAVELLSNYASSFTSVLPSHIDGGQWMNKAIGILRSNQQVAQAAVNDPGAFLGAVHRAASLGLEPGTDQFYLVPFSPKKGQPRIIQGIVGYQGEIELIYRAGAVSSVIVELVHEKDGFDYRPGVDERPMHTVDWMAGDRGKIVLVYAYAVMKDGATSKVVVMNQSDIDRVKESSASASSPYGPWSKHPGAMWMKTAARQLAKWVPTSAEYRREQLRAAQEVASEFSSTHVQQMPAPAHPEFVDESTGEVVDAELVPQGNGPVPEVSAVSRSSVRPASQRAVAFIQMQFQRLEVTDREERLYWTGQIAGRPIGSTKELTQDEGKAVSDVLEKLRDRQALEALAELDAARKAVAS